MVERKQSVEIESGAFPFPLLNGPVESRYLTWLRNHSNYMVEGGLRDYLRIIAVLVRGIVINFLILLPYFLAFAALLALVHLFLSQPHSVKVAWANDTDQGGGGAIRETLTVTVHSNFGENDTIEVQFDPRPDKAAEAMRTLFFDVADASGQFDSLQWDLKGKTLVGLDTSSGNEIRIEHGELAAAIDDDTTTEITKLLFSRSAFFFSRIVLSVAAALIILYPVFMRMNRVRRFRSALATGHLSSVVRRDWYERAFGTLLLLILVVAALESFPRLSVLFHSLRQGEVAIAIPTLTAMFGGLVAANRALPVMGGLARKIAMVAVGLLGLMIPLVLVLFVIEFLVYSDMENLIARDFDIYVALALVVLPVIFAILLFATWLIGLRDLTFRGHMKLILLFLAMIAMAVAIIAGAVAISSAYPDEPRYLFTYYVFAAAIEITVYCWLAVDVNQTSINGLYRDRLATAYLIGVDTKGDIGIEQDINLQEICNYDAGSTAPYHLINTALNLQGTKDIGIRDRKSDFFMFSKRFIGGDRTGYCRSENMEALFPQMDLGTAMAISAAAAAPNMGRGTNRLMVAFLTLLNIRLGFWVPNPDRLEKYLHKPAGNGHDKALEFFHDVFPGELGEIAKRRAQAYAGQAPRALADRTLPTVAHDLVGIAFSGGGIRSATINLGIAQALHRRGIFDHLDYMSTVSGGGYLGASLSTLMRHRVSPYARVKGRIAGVDAERRTMLIESDDDTQASAEYAFAATAQFAPDIGAGTAVAPGTRLLARARPDGDNRAVSLMDSFSWRVRPSALRREILSNLDATHDWVNLSDGGHIENMAAIELLRRRCRIIFIGDGEADRKMHFAGLATLVRYARIDLGIGIDLNVSDIRLAENGLSKAHFAVGRIRYPADPDYGATREETGYLVYLKSSCTGDEDEVIQEYRSRKPHFPHETTADQMFDEGQFEAYRALGQHIVESALPGAGDAMSFDDLVAWVEGQTAPVKPKPKPKRSGSRKTA